MKFRCLALTALFVLPAIAAESTPPPSPTRVAVIRFQDAVLSTQDGQRAAAALRAKFDPLKAQLEKRGAELDAIHQKLGSGAAGMTPEARSQMQADFDRRARDLKHEVDNLNAELEQDESKILQDMAAKMSDVIQKYATSNGFKLVLDVSSQQTPIVWADASSNISADIVKAYDAAHPVAK